MKFKKYLKTMFWKAQKIKILIIFLVLVVIFSFAILALSQRNTAHIVILTDKGFSPNNITIQQGDTIVFKTDTNRDFWPASNIHPTHDIYPEFDPKRPLSPHEEWSFKFDKVGNWRFHDHLNEYAVGEIIVLGSDEAVFSYKEIDECGIDESSNKSKCYEDAVYSVLEQHGIFRALDAVGKIYESGDNLLVDCHGLMHEVGRRAFIQFNEGRDFELSDKTSYCGYGFYHGFMEQMLLTTGDVGKAREFCDYTDRVLIETTSDAGGACYHGIGHGVVEDEPHPSIWGNAQAIIDEGLKLCEMVSNTNDRLFRCASGVYNGYEILATQNKYNLTHDYSDPFLICRLQEDKYKEACYTQLVVPVLHLVGTDYLRGVKYIDTISEDKYAISTLISLTVERSRTIPDKYEEVINDCRSISSRFHLPCIYAYSEGFLKYGPPEIEYIKSIDFCSSSLLTREEKMACFGHVLSLLRIFYTVEKSKEICESVDSEVRNYNCYY